MEGFYRLCLACLQWDPTLVDLSIKYASAHKTSGAVLLHCIQTYNLALLGNETIWL